ncbi:hypothetical protein SAMN05660690_4556 [Geodermatophilus telluris]|uniref:Uncharacterized protein n=1 Tax=Geodermatophilus telluris TaxID=1190417 RepID=A0A1G6VRH8_9ACTN|nr:hypothetical protein [Geodermatophilus telluris]SDD56023.1 hypothetical protein SAMN05660690_4556 [Geodermatophilus telluris]
MLALAAVPRAPGGPPRPPPAGLATAPAGEGWTALLGDAARAVDAVLALARQGGWRIGVGAVPDPAGDADVLLAARRALAAGARRPARLAVRGPDPAAAADAQAVLTALAVLLARRTAPAWAAVDLVAAGRTRAAAAAELGVSRQAVAQRLAAGLWDLEQELRPTAVRLLARAAGDRAGARGDHRTPENGTTPSSGGPP